MKTIKVSDIYNVTQISKTNSDAWERLYKLMENETEDVLFDFKDINLEEPWNNEAFKKFIGNERVHMKIYSSEKIKDTIELACKLGNLKTGRVINEDEIVEVEPVKDLKQEKLIQNIVNNISIVEDTGMLYMPDVASQITNHSTVTALEKAIVGFAETTHIKKLAIDTETMFIQVNIIELLANMIGKLKSQGIDVIIMSRDPDISGKINMYRCFSGSRKLTPRERIKIFKETLQPNTVGMLSKFKDTRRVDEFGRKGDGKPIMCRVAIYKGIKNGQVHFITFNGKYFFTKLHYSLDHDGEELKNLVTEHYSMPVEQVGLTDKFTGLLYHFNLPIQYSKDDYIQSYCEDEDGVIRQVQLTLPQYIKMVLDSFGVMYNGASLIYAITKTRDFLDKLDRMEYINDNNYI
mgnify:FL=1